MTPRLQGGRQAPGPLAMYHSEPPPPTGWKMTARLDHFSSKDDTPMFWYAIEDMTGRHIESLSDVDNAVFEVLEMARERAAEREMAYSPRWASAKDFAEVANEFKGPNDRVLSAGYVAISLLRARLENGLVASDTRGLQVSVWRLTERGQWALKEMKRLRKAEERKLATGKAKKDG